MYDYVRTSQYESSFVCSYMSAQTYVCGCACVPVPESTCLRTCLRANVRFFFIMLDKRIANPTLNPSSPIRFHGIWIRLGLQKNLKFGSEFMREGYSQRIFGI